MNSVLSSEIEIIPIKPEHQQLIDEIVNDLAELKKQNNGQSFIEFGDKNTKLFSHQGVIKGFCNIPSIQGHPYIDVYVLRQYRGQGLGPAVTIKLREMLFDMGHSVVGILVHKDNLRAIESAKKSGFVMSDENEELNKENKADTYYKFVARNYRNANDRGYSH